MFALCAKLNKFHINHREILNVFFQHLNIITKVEHIQKISKFPLEYANWILNFESLLSAIVMRMPVNQLNLHIKIFIRNKIFGAHASVINSYYKSVRLLYSVEYSCNIMLDGFHFDMYGFCKCEHKFINSQNNR